VTVYGGAENSPPYEYLDASGQPQGFNVELMGALAKTAGRAVEFRLGRWSEMLKQLDKGEVDLVSMAYAESRTERYDFLAETWTARQSLLFPAGRAGAPTRLTDMAGEIVAVEEGSLAHDLFRSMPDASRPLLRTKHTHVDAVKALQRGEATAVAGNALVLRVALADLGTTDVVEIPVKVASYHIVTSRGRGHELAWVTDALVRLRESGEYSRLVERYLATPRPAKGLRQYLGLLATGFAVALALGAGGVAWSVSLKRQVTLRTDELARFAREKENAEAEATRARSLLEATLESTADGILVVDPHGRVTSFNRRFAELWELPQAELDKSDDAALIAYVLDQLAAPSEFKARIDELYADPAAESFDLLAFKDGRVFERYSQPQLLGEQGVGRVWSFRDVSERENALRRVERANRDLEAKNQELERFAYTVSHDLRSPLITIQSFADLLAGDLEAGRLEELPGHLQRVDRAVKTMDRLLTELLELSRVGRVVHPAQDVPLAIVAQEAVELVRGRLEKGRVEVEVAADLPTVRGDRRRLLEVFQNLLDNAAKFMGDAAQPHVEVGMRRDGDDNVYYVRDNGMGIERRHIDRVFGLFDKLEPGGDGTGIGLALVQRIVEAHHGRAWAESEGRGRGSTFCFTLHES
jgi:signal transduction histidine kinase